MFRVSSSKYRLRFWLQALGACMVEQTKERAVNTSPRSRAMDPARPSGFLLAATYAALMVCGSATFASSADQVRMDSFYDLNNIVTVNITMPQVDWDNLRNAQPYGGVCNFAYVGSRYDWYTAASVTIQTTQFPYVNGSFTFNNVGIKKKSYCGSISSTKPSLHLKYAAADEPAVEALIGTKHLMFNNSIQDGEYIRQCLGYKLLGEAGVPTARCNFSRLIVNGNVIGVYVNVEPMKKRLAEKNFAGNDNGNVYELDLGEDFVASMFSRIEWDGFSSVSNKADLSLANSQIAGGSYASVVDEEAFIRLWAMEIILKHWDGYANNRNNTYLYNDVPNPVATPTAADVNFKFVPSGIDQILQGGSYTVYNNSILAANFAANSAYKSRLRFYVHFLLNNVFSYYRHNNSTVPYINSAVSIVNGLLAQSAQGPVNSANVAAITAQLAGLRGSMNTLFGFNFNLAEADFDGDGRTDRTVWRPSQAKFYTILSSTGAVNTPIFGAAGDIPVAGDFDGDGRVDWALWRPSTGVWDVRNSTNGAHTFTTLGTNGDVPVAGDFDGDAKADLTVWSPATATFSTRYSSTGTVVQVSFGANGDIPVVGNYDADRKTDYALWRPSTGDWDILSSATSTHGFRNWGTNGDVPVTRDFDLDGKSDISVWRSSQAKFYTILSATNTVSTPIFGAAGDIPTIGDVDGDVGPDYGLWRPSTGDWDILIAATGLHLQQHWGTSGDVPVPRPQN